MKLEAVTVCIDYGPKLRQCIENARFFDKWAIVTVERDKETIDLCRNKPNIELVYSDRIYEGGAPFAKGRAVNEGLQRLDMSDWIIHIDADVRLPSNFKKVINPPAEGSWIFDPTVNSATLYSNQLDPEFIYGSVRYKEDGTPTQETIPETNEPYDSVGMRFCNGYFQLWHSSIEITYPENSTDARQDDMSHFTRWPLDKRRFLPLKVIDIDQEHNRNHFGVR